MSEQVARHGLAARRTAGAWLTRGQMTLRAVQLGLLAALLLVMRLVNVEGTSLLVRDPRGQKLLIGALALTAGVLGAHLLACAALNRLAPPGDEARATRRRVLSWLLEGALFPLLYLPLVLVLFIGPPVLRILEALTRP
jgi:hypothetical protein